VTAADDEALVRKAFADWARGDYDAVLAHIDPDVEWETNAPVLDLASKSRGHDAVRAFWDVWKEGWVNIHPEPEEFIRVGDELLVLARWRGTSRGGIEMDQPVALRLRIENGIMTRYISYWDRSQAFMELGLPLRD
jgi:ketosteroid isomerase-like protein